MLCVYFLLYLMATFLAYGALFRSAPGESSRQHPRVVARPNSKLRMRLEVLQETHMEMMNCIRSSMVREEAVESLATIDMLQRLGIDYLFQEEIEFLLQNHYHRYIAAAKNSSQSFFSAALSFRLLRQHGHYVEPNDIFHQFIKDFKSWSGNLHGEALIDVRSLVALHETSYFGIDQGEEVLDEVCNLSKQLLQQLIVSNSSYSKCQKQLIMKTIHHPLQRSLTRFTLKQYLQTLVVNDEDRQRSGSKTRALQELAVADYNIVQSMHRKDLQQIFKWWENLGISKDVAFARQNPAEWFICSMAILSNPRHASYRILLAKSIAFIYIIDDVYDLYGTLNQLTAFTEAIKGWDEDRMKELPRCMQAIFAALSSFLNKLADKVIQQHGWDPIFILRKLWSGLCDAFLKEANWLASDSVPSSGAYLKTSTKTTGAPLLLAQVSLMLGSSSGTDLQNDIVDLLQNDSGLFYNASKVFRLSDDLRSSSRRQGEYDGCYVDYYMKENGDISLGTAVDHVRSLIALEWKKMNKECLAGIFSGDVRMASLNMARLGQWLYPCDDLARHGATENDFYSLLEDL